MPDIVAIQIGNDRSPRLSEPFVSGCGPIGFCEFDVPNALIIEGAHDIRGLVGAIIIADDQFPVLVGLIQHALDGFTDGEGPVVGGHDDADQRRVGQRGAAYHPMQPHFVICDGPALL